MDVERLHLPSSSGLSIPDQSFSRTNSCFSDDLYMSVCESPVPETDVDLDCDFLSLNSRHIDSTTDADSSFQSASDSLFQSDISGQDTGDEALAKEIEEDPVLCTFSHLLKPFNLPHFIDELPRWNAFQDEIRNLRQTDLAESKALEESNMGIYGSGLALRVIEEVRWYNEVSKDPELSRLVHELDPQFPLAMHKPSISIEDFNIATPSSDRSRASSFCIDVPSSARVEEARIRSIYDGVDEFFLRRKLDPSWHFVAANAIAKAFSRSPIRDPRVLIWVQDIVNNIEQAVSLPLCTANSSEMMVGNTIVHLRGTSDWAPPRDAWIFTPMLVKDHKSLLEAQQYKCAGCGLKIEHEYIKRVRVCEYYGKLFCQACHNGSKFIIPAKVLKFWNFTEAPVSDRALRFLTDAKDQAAIHLSVVEPNLIQKISALKKTIYLREKLGHMWEFVRHCEIADETVTGHGNLTTLFTSLEKHLLQSKDVFSLSDFTRVHNKDLLNHLEPIANYAKCHIENCEKCQNRAFVCWLCVDATDLLFPFQLEKIHRCDECGSLAHKICVTKRVKLRGKLECTKCERCEKQRLDRQRIASISEA